MKTIYIVKIVSIILIFSMIFSFIPNLSFASNGEESLILLKDIVFKIMKVIISIISGILKDFVIPSTMPTEVISKTPINIATSTKTFAEIAEECKNVIYKNNFSYDDNTYGKGGDWGKVNFSNGEDKGNPASSKRYSKEIDCSGYVSWVLFKYGSTSSSRVEYKQKFYTQQGTKNMKKIIDANPNLFKKIGTLDKCDSKLLKGDILLKNGHVEIFSEKRGGTYYCYNAGATKAIQGGISTVGQCNTEKSEYTVYRVIK